jgi:quinol monooxygenase YgiN
MPVFKIARFRIRPESREAVEQAMREFAKYVAFELTGSSWVTYRDAKDPDRYVSLISADDEDADLRHREATGTQRFVDALYPNVVGEVEFTDYSEVAAST